MTIAPYPPSRVIPPELAQALANVPHWFVIGGQAVRCFAPYRSSRDIDLGVSSVERLEGLVAQLRRTGKVEVLERAADTIHLQWNDIKVSAFVLPRLVPHVEGQRLSVAGILATKVHAVLDRGLRRDFFDLYVMLQQHRLGVAECLAALRQVYQAEVGDSQLLRALTYFDDAENEPPLPGEGPGDFVTVKQFFLERVGNLLVPPTRPLAIQRRVVDVAAAPPAAADGAAAGARKRAGQRRVKSRAQSRRSR